ncbi:MAG: hypothetical protein H6828_03095 [Planctomycetes bacterium]|nr:hypothetical protein [Planctomycetota bacterium]
MLLALGGLWFAAERWRAPAADAAAPQEAPGDVAPIAARRTTPATPRARTSERDEAAPVEAIPAPAPPESDPDAGTGMR